MVLGEVIELGCGGTIRITYCHSKMDVVAGAVVKSKIKGLTKDIESAVGLNEEQSTCQVSRVVNKTLYCMREQDVLWHILCCV